MDMPGTNFRKLKIFVEVKKRFAFLSIEPENKSHFNKKHVMILSSFAFCLIAMSAFVFIEAKAVSESKDFVEIGNAFYGASIMAVNMVTFSSNVLKSTQIFELITSLEDFINGRKLLYE